MFGSDHTHRATNRTWIIDTRTWQWVISVSKVNPTPPVKVPVVHGDDNDNSNDDKSALYNKITGGIMGGIAGLVMYYYYLYFFYVFVHIILL